MSSEVLAVTVAGVGANLAYTHEVAQKARKARESADDAGDKADEALSGLEKLANSGAVVRGDAPSVADFEVGISQPQQVPATSVGPYATAPQPLTRPILSEDDAAEVSPYPGAVSEYTRAGLLKDTQNAKGQNVLVGVALRFVELRAFLLGLLYMTGNGQNPDKSVIRQFFRFAQGIARALYERVTVSEPDGMTQDSYTDAIRRLLSGAVGGYRKIAQLMAGTTGKTGTGLAAETTIFSLTVPANTLAKDGDQIIIEGGGQCVTLNAGDTHRVRARLNIPGGGLLADTEAAIPIAGRAYVLRAVITRVGANQVRVCGASGWGATNQNPLDLVATWDFTVANEVAFTVQHASASAANVTQISAAALYAVS